MAQPKAIEKAQEPVKVEEKQAETKTIINNAVRSFTTSAGVLAVGSSQTLPVKEADALLDYDGIVDAAKYSPPGSVVDNLRKENAALKARIKELEEGK